MAVTPEIVRAHKDTGNTATYTVSFGAGVPVGSTLVVAVDAPVTAAISAFSITDSKGNSYTPRRIENTTPVNFQLLHADSLISNAIVPGDTMTISVTGASPAKWAVLAFAADNITSFDKGGAAVGSGQPWSVSSAAGAQNSQLVVGIVGYTDSTGVITSTPNDGSTSMADETSSPGASPRSLALQWRMVNASGVRTASGDLNGSSGWGAIIGVYNATAAVADATHYVLTQTNAADTTATGSRTYKIDATTSVGAKSLVQTSGTAVGTITESPTGVFNFADPGGTDDLVFRLTAGSTNKTITIPRGAGGKPEAITFYGGTVGNVNNWG